MFATRLLITLAMASALSAQVSTGTVSGTTTDPAGAVVAGAKITLRHLATGDVRELVTGDRGDFSAKTLKSGFALLITHINLHTDRAGEPSP